MKISANTKRTGEDKNGEGKNEENIDGTRSTLTIITQVHIIMMFGTNFRQATVMMLHLLRISFIKIVRATRE